MTDGTAAARLDSSGPRQLGPYRLLGVLGSGASGTVHLGRGAARRGARKRLAAVRALRPELLRDRQLRARLRHETNAAAATRSPYLAAALGCELDSERPWVAAEFVPGLPLAALVSRYGPLPEAGARALGGALARALDALHSARLTHRGVRARNVLLAADAPRLVDQGLGAGPAETGHAHGADVVDPAGDVFDLGVTLAVAAGGRYPFSGSALPTARDGPDLSGVPEALWPALLACLHKTPEARPLPGALAHSLDLADTAALPAVEWLPDTYREAIRAYEAGLRKMTGRRRFGR